MMSPAMLLLSIALISVFSVSLSREIPRHAPHSHKHHHVEATTPRSMNSLENVNDTNISDSKKNTPTSKPTEVPTFQPNDILIKPKGKNETAKVDEADEEKVIPSEKGAKPIDSKKTPITSLKTNGKELPPAAMKPKHVTHLLTKNPESINLTTRKLFERDDYGPNTTEKKEKII